MATALPEPKSSPGGLFTSRLTELAVCAEVNVNAVTGSGPAVWYRPGEFDSSLFNLTEMGRQFVRTQQVDEFMASVTNKESFGSVGDLLMSQLQGDLLGAMERAWRARHSSSCRTRIHPAARLAGHAAVTGPIQQGMRGYIVGIDKLNKGEAF